MFTIIIALWPNAILKDKICNAICNLGCFIQLCLHYEFKKNYLESIFTCHKQQPKKTRSVKAEPLILQYINLNREKNQSHLQFLALSGCYVCEARKKKKTYRITLSNLKALNSYRVLECWKKAMQMFWKTFFGQFWLFRQTKC